MTVVYVLVNERGELYCGSTNNITERLKEHNRGMVPSTRGHAWKLAYGEVYADEHEARVREQKLKQHKMAWTQLKRRIAASISHCHKGSGR